MAPEHARLAAAQASSLARFYAVFQIIATVIVIIGFGYLVGYKVTASLLVGKLQSYPRQNALSKALQEYGRLVKTIFILRYIDSEDYRRRIGTQINKGEALHALRNYLFFANEGKVRRRHQEEQANQASCLNLVVNAIVTWNTVYMNEVISRLRREGIAIADVDVAHLSPARYGHINPYGKYRFDIDAAPDPATLRPLRDPEVT